MSALHMFHGKMRRFELQLLTSGAGDGARYPVFLGRAHGHDEHGADGEGALPNRSTARPGTSFWRCLPSWSRALGKGTPHTILLVKQASCECVMLGGATCQGTEQFWASPRLPHKDPARVRNKTEVTFELHSILAGARCPGAQDVKVAGQCGGSAGLDRGVRHGCAALHACDRYFKKPLGVTVSIVFVHFDVHIDLADNDAAGPYGFHMNSRTDCKNWSRL